MTRSFSRVTELAEVRRADPGERGFVLISVLVLAFLFFALIQLVLAESSQALRGASRFRGWVVAQTLAENAAELAALGVIRQSAGTIDLENDEGEMKAAYSRPRPDTFIISASGRSGGVSPSDARVRINGRVVCCPERLKIDRIDHNP